jgi:hypothetical protein
MTMKVINITLLCDGTSDFCIQNLIQSVCDAHFSEYPMRITIARELVPAKGKLHTRIEAAFRKHDPNIVVCHRDAEKVSFHLRKSEIENAVELSGIPVPVVPAIPVRMLESWLLVSANAIRCAASNRSGKVALPLPRPKEIEDIPDPKAELFSLLKIATELPPQRLRRFNEQGARSRVASFLDDLSELRKIPSFSDFEAALCSALKSQIADQL